jgi:protein-disulfide isomerase
VTLVEYGDYECPHCGRAHVILQELRAQGSRFRLAYRHFPLAAIHPHAEPAAEAAEAAGAQGHFWDMHKLLFEHQGALDMVHLLGYARALSLDLNRFTAELRDRTFAPKVKEDFLSGARSGVNGTPTFFINGQRHTGSYELPSLLAAIQSAAGAGGSVKRAR